MDIWQISILGGAAVLVIYSLIQSAAERRRMEKHIDKLFAYASQIKDNLRYLAAIQDYGNEVIKRIPLVEQEELERIEKGLTRSTFAISALLYTKMENSFKSLKGRPFLNVALQSKDLNAIDIILELIWGPEFRRYRVSLLDDEIAPILDILEELSSKNEFINGSA